MNQTPLPFVVCAMTHPGPPLRASPDASMQPIVIVPVHLDDAPAEGAPLVGERLERQGLLTGAEALDLVVSR